MKRVSKEEFEQYISEYRGNLETNFFMDAWTWVDFSKGNCFDGIMAMKAYSYNDSDPYIYFVTEKGVG